MKNIFFSFFVLASTSLSSFLVAAPPDIIVFDFGGVVGEVNAKKLTRKVKKELLISRSEAKSIVKKALKKKSHKKGSQNFWEAYKAKSGKNIPTFWADRYNQIRRDSMCIAPQIAKIIRDLKKRGYKVALLSNVNARRAKSLRKMGLYKPFHPVVLSCDIHTEKPHAKAYLKLLKKLGNVHPQRCFFIDDRKENVAAAIRLGMQAVQYKSAERLRWELELRNILPAKTIHRKKHVHSKPGF